MSQQATEEEFQFLHCQGCRAEAKCPKLLPCLHTLCSGCLEESGRQCPICQAPWPPGADAEALDNVFFESLQRRLSVYRQIVDAQALCTRCKEPADFWCFECEQLLCVKCVEAHQWFLKHEARPLAELRSQSVSEFLDATRKSNNIFCSNPNHRSPTLTRLKARKAEDRYLVPRFWNCVGQQALCWQLWDTLISVIEAKVTPAKMLSPGLSIYCRGCSKPLCCSCALLDRGHSELKCDISAEIQQRQQELDAMTQALQEQDSVFGAAQAQMRSAVSQLGRVRSCTEELIRQRVQQVVAHVLAQEQELLAGVNARYQRNYEEIAGQLGRLDAVLQRIRTGSVLVQRMKRYASDQEVLDMHGFLCKALHHLRQEEPQNLQAATRTDSFDEFKMRLQDLVSCITQGTDAAPSKKASPAAASSPRDPLDIDLPIISDYPCFLTSQPEVAQRAQVQASGLAAVQPVPGAHPVPVYAYSMKDPSCREEVSNTATPQKRKSCQTEYPRKVIKMESEEEKEARKPKACSIPSVSCPQPRPNGEGKAQEERIVVISSSEDSDAENSPSQEPDDSSSESGDLQLEGPSSLGVLDKSLAESQAEDRPLVFFDLKIDNETQKISQLAAVNQESQFRALIQPEAFGIYSKAVSLEVGLQHFLRFLDGLHRPVLACYQLWGPSLPSFFQALEDMNRLSEFQKAISGFLAALPLIQECVPGASSFKLKSLARTYLARNVNERSALAAVLAMRDLCRLLEVSPGPRLAPHIYPFSSLQCFASLQPLVRAALLPRAQARLLALHKVSFMELLTAHRHDPQGGLKKYNHFLSPQTPSSPLTQSVLNVQALGTYFEGLLEEPALAQSEGIATRLAGRSLAERAPQES
ncbi:protein PML isoform 1 [Camelus ferus]|nr:protein PML isoform 1 [Camelus ferus]